MPDNVAGVSPDTVPDTIPASAGGTPPASSLKQEAAPDFASLVASAKTPADVEALIKQFKAAPPPAAPAKAEEPVTPAPEAAEEVNKTGEDSTPAEPATPEEKPEGQTTEPDPAPEPENEDDDPVNPISAAKTRLRLNEDDEVGRLAAAYKQRNKDWTLKQAMEAAERQLGKKSEQANEQPKEPGAKPEGPQTVEEIDAAIDKLETERSKAVKDLRFEDTDEIDKQMRRLERKRLVVDRDNQAAEAQKQRASAAKYHEDFDKSEKQAVELYPDATNPNSEFGKRMLEIERSLEATRDPVFSDPNKPLIIAQMAARELRIAPKAKGAATPAKPALKPAAPAATPAAKPKQMLPAGGSATNPPANPSSELSTKLQSVQNPHQLKTVLAQAGIRLPNM